MGSEPDNPGKLPESDVTVTAIDGDVRRGLPLHLQGAVASGGGACGQVRVDVLLVGRPEHGRDGKRAGEPASVPGTVLGSLSTDEKGKFDGAVVIPRDIALGDYDLVVQTPGDTRCGPGRTK
jgi:hypothetical protein